MRCAAVIGSACLVAAVMAGCARVRIPEPTLPPKKDYYRPLPPGAHALRRLTDPESIPDFRDAFEQDHASLLAALDESIRYFGLPSSRKHFPLQGITHAQAAASLIYFRDILTSSATAEEFQERVVSAFDVYQSVGCDDRGTVLFTGYYTPIFDGSLERTDEFRWPLYSQPKDLVKGADGSVLGRRLDNGDLVPYDTRREIEEGAATGNELVYLRSRFEAYICTVQGSAHLRLLDGRLFRIGYAASNGREYTSVGRKLVADGLLAPEQLNLSGLTAFFQSEPERMDDYLPLNERYVFFQETDTPPLGSLGLPVTARRSLATDKSIYPRGCLAYAETRVPDFAGGVRAQQRFRQFMLDQDTGGAIRAAGRADIYLGIGDEAGRIAGWTLSEGRLYYLFLRNEPEVPD